MEKYGDEMFCKRMNEIFREYKERNNKFSRRKFADLLGVTKGQIDGWMSGQGQPDLSTLIKISHRLKVPVDFLIGISSARTTEKIEFYHRLTPEAINELEYYFNYLACKYNIER